MSQRPDLNIPLAFNISVREPNTPQSSHHHTQMWGRVYQVNIHVKCVGSPYLGRQIFGCLKCMSVFRWSMSCVYLTCIVMFTIFIEMSCPPFPTHDNTQLLSTTEGDGVAQ